MLAALRRGTKEGEFAVSPDILADRRAGRCVRAHVAQPGLVREEEDGIKIKRRPRPRRKPGRAKGAQAQGAKAKTGAKKPRGGSGPRKKSNRPSIRIRPLPNFRSSRSACVDGRGCSHTASRQMALVCPFLQDPQSCHGTVPQWRNPREQSPLAKIEPAGAGRRCADLCPGAAHPCHPDRSARGHVVVRQSKLRRSTRICPRRCRRAKSAFR